MSRRNRIALFLLLLVFAGCSKPRDIVLTVGSKEVAREEFERIYKEYREQFSGNPVSKATLISQLIEGEILNKEASKMKIAFTAGELDGFMKENSIQEKYKRTAEVFVLREKVSLKLAEGITAGRVQIDEIKKRLPDIVPERIIFYQILLNNQEKAYKVLDEINKGGDFEVAARQHSIAPEGKRGGIVDYLNAEEIPREIAKILKILKPGEISRVVQSPYGYHILKMKEFVKSRRIAEEEKEEKAKNEAIKEASGNAYADWFAKKRKEYKVNVKWEELEKIN
jgi:parvulin-like peptidyl-prolyl isomerase